MLLKRWGIYAGILTALLAGYRVASAFFIAMAIAPPHSSPAAILRLAVHPRFQMATPHRNLLTKIKLELVPSAQACGSPSCDGTESKPTCYGCQAGFCYCPGCQMTGCTVYSCVTTGSHRTLCQQAYNKDPNCNLCENDYNTGCTPIGP